MKNKYIDQPIGYLFIKTSIKLERYKFLVSTTSGSALFYDTPASGTGEYSGVAIVNQAPSEIIDISHQVGRSRQYMVIDSQHILRSKGALEDMLSIDYGQTAILFNPNSLPQFECEKGGDVRWWCSVEPHTLSHALSDCLRAKLSDSPYDSVAELESMLRLESLLMSGIRTWSAGMAYTSLKQSLGEYAEQIIEQLDPERFRKDQMWEFERQQSSLKWSKEQELLKQQKHEELKAALKKFKAG